MEKCPRCDFPLPAGAAECPACGIVVSKYRARSARAASPPVAAPAAAVPQDPPVEESRGVEREDPGANPDARGARAGKRSVTLAGCLLDLLTVFLIAGSWVLARFVLNPFSPPTLPLAVHLLFLGASVFLLVRGIVSIVASRPARAMALTFVVPGLGHIYGREPKRALVITLVGLILIGGFRVSGMVMAFPGLLAALLLSLIFQLWVSRDAFVIVRRHEGLAPKAYNRWSLCALALALLAIYLGPQILGLRAFKTPSGNMEPVILPGDHLFADMARYRFTRPARGDLVIFNSPEKPEALQMGRVMGLEGEDFEIRNKKVYVDSRPLSDPWGQHSDTSVFMPGSLSTERDQRAPGKIPAGTVFVLGDNRDGSYDSRFFGPVPLSMIRGRPLFVYWATDKSRIGTPLR